MSETGVRRGSAGATVLMLAFVACVAVLAFNKIDDTDTWTHLAFGRWIWTHAAVATHEPFITHAEPFAYQNWLFGLAYYLAFAVGGLAGVTVLKALVVTALFALLLALALRPQRRMVLAVAVLFAVALMLRARFVERPDTVMMLSLAATLWCLQAYVDSGCRWLYAVPLVHWLWANSHTSIVLMAVPFFAYLIGGWAQGRIAGALTHRVAPSRLGFAPGLTASQLRTIAVVFAFSLAASLLSPYGLAQFTHSIQAVQSDWWRQEIGELQRPGWVRFAWLYLLDALVVASFALNHRRVSLIDLLVALPMLVLSLEAIRFTWFAAIGAVYLVRNVAEFAADRRLQWRGRSGEIACGVAALAVAAATALHLARVPPLDTERIKQTGVGINPTLLPEGALAYLDRVGVTGQVFNLFQWGGYLTWRDLPRRTPFIDGRGFRDDALLERVGRAEHDSRVLDEFQRQFGFESVLAVVPVARHAFDREALRAGLVLSRPNWALVYWDDLSIVLLRRGGPYAETIARDEYRHALPYGVVDRGRLADPAYRQGVLDELRRNLLETGSSRARINLAFTYNEIGEARQALAVLDGVRSSVFIDFESDAHVQRGHAYRRLGEIDAAIRSFEQVPPATRNVQVWQSLAALHAEQGRRAQAIEYYEQALRLEPGLEPAYPALAALYRAVGRSDAAEQTMQRLRGQAQITVGRRHFEAGTKAYLAGDYHLAIAELEKSIAAHPLSATPYTNLGYVYYDMGQLDQALQQHRRALELDAAAANSHYGLALIYRDRHDAAQAIGHWQEYLKLEPSGVHARKAKQEIEALRR